MIVETTTAGVWLSFASGSTLQDHLEYRVGTGVFLFYNTLFASLSCYFAFFVYGPLRAPVIDY